MDEISVQGGLTADQRDFSRCEHKVGFVYASAVPVDSYLILGLLGRWCYDVVSPCWWDGVWTDIKKWWKNKGPSCSSLDFFFKSAFLSFGGLAILTIKRTTLKDIGVDQHWFKFICHAESFSCRDMPWFYHLQFWNVVLHWYLGHFKSGPFFFS